MHLTGTRSDPIAAPSPPPSDSAAHLDALFRPRSVAFVGGSNLAPALAFHREVGFAGDTWVVSPKYPQLAGYPCVATVEDLPQAPDLAFVAIPREAAITAIAALRDKGCRAVVCNAAGFAETGEAGGALQARLAGAAGPMAMLGPNAIGVVNYADPMAAIMDRFGVRHATRGIALCSQGGGLLCDAVFSDRGLAITHLVGAGNQAVTGLEACVDHLLDDPRVTTVGLSFEALRDVAALRRAAIKALALGKPIVALKLGTSHAGARAAVSHTASMTGESAAWDALLDRLGIVSTASESEFFETLKLFESGQIPAGRRALVTAASGVTGVMLADHLSAAGFELPEPTGDRLTRLRRLLPPIATPGNPQDITMAAWNDVERQTAIYSALLDEGYDLALVVQNYPRGGMWDPTEYEAQVEALAAATAGREVAALQLAPLVDCFPSDARDHTRRLGLAAMQGLEECVKALGHGVWWRERRDVLLAAGVDRLGEVTAPAPAPPAPAPADDDGPTLDEAAAKAHLTGAGVRVPVARVVKPGGAARAAEEIGFPVAVKALDARILHKTDAGAVAVGLTSGAAVAAAVERMRRDMARALPAVPLHTVLVEAMVAEPVAELIVSITADPVVGHVMMLGGGGVEAELWQDTTVLAAPFDRDELARALDRLKVARRLRGWRGRPGADCDALLDTLERLAGFAVAEAVRELEVNPLFAGVDGTVAVDALLRI